MRLSAKKDAPKSASPTEWSEFRSASKMSTTFSPTSIRRSRRFDLAHSHHRLFDPIQVRRVAVADGDLNALRNFIRMQPTERIAQRSEGARRSLDDKQILGRSLNLALPAIDRFDTGNDVDASCEPPLDQRMSNRSRLFH